MRFDDRIATLLTLPGSDGHDVAIRWRQLVDVVSRVGQQEEKTAPFIAALAVIRADRGRVPLAIRAASARSIAGRPLPHDLIELFASDVLAVNAPLLAAAPAGKTLLRRLFAVADNDTRQFLETLHPADPEPAEDGQTLGDVVARVEQRRSQSGKEEPPTETITKDAALPQPASEPKKTEPASAKGDKPHAEHHLPPLFRWETSEDGQVSWVDALPRAAMIGRSLRDVRDSRIADAIAARAAFADEPLEALGAEWRWSGEPEFAADDGRFLGYRGVARRAGAREGGLPKMEPEAAQRPSATIAADPDSLRELVHEIRTPLNAIIGFAEIIDGQYLGPAHRRYRERAAEIVTQARILLGAIEDMDLAARLQFRAADPGDNCDLGALGPWVDEQLRPVAERGDVILRFDRGHRDYRCALDDALVKRLIKRLMSGLISAADAQEILSMRLELKDNRCSLVVSKPRSLQGMLESRLLDPGLTLEGKGKSLLGVGFSLRLVRGLARIVGGDLLIDEDSISLDLPSLS